MIKLLEAKVIADLLNQEEVNEFLDLHQNTDNQIVHFL